MKALWRKEWLVYGRWYLPAWILVILVYFTLMSAAMFPPVIDFLPLFAAMALPAAMTMYKDAQSGWNMHTTVMCRQKEVLLVKIGIAIFSAMIVFTSTWMICRRAEGAMAGALCTLAAGCLGILIGSFRMSSAGWQIFAAVIGGLSCLLYAAPVSRWIRMVELVNAGYGYIGIQASETIPPFDIFRFCGIPLLLAGICIVLTIALAKIRE